MKIARKLVTFALALVISISTMAVTAFAAENTMYGIGFVTGEGLRLRAEADTSAKILESAPKNDCVVVIAKEGDWYRVNYNLQEGYMHADYLKVLTKENAELGYGKVTGDDVNLRSGPSTSHSALGQADKGDKLYILGLNEGWYKILLDGKTAYIRSDFLELTEAPYENKASDKSPRYFRGGKAIGTAPGSAETSDASGKEGSAVSVSGQDILDEAKKYLGTRYVYGGASPSGFDCSGFMYYVLKQVGYSPYRTLSKQYKEGTAVDKDELQVGDIVFFANTYAKGLSHVGIYAGDGQFIHSPNSRSTVSYSDLTTGYWSDHYYGARRMG